jgi:hypothetical protein
VGREKVDVAGDQGETSRVLVVSGSTKVVLVASLGRVLRADDGPV